MPDPVEEGVELANQHRAEEAAHENGEAAEILVSASQQEKRYGCDEKKDFLRIFSEAVLSDSIAKDDGIEINKGWRYQQKKRKEYEVSECFKDFPDFCFWCCVLDD